MKSKQIQLAEIWRGNSVYRLMQVKGDRSRFIVTQQDPMSLDDYAYTIVTEYTLPAAMIHWEKLFPDDDNDNVDIEEEVI